MVGRLPTLLQVCLFCHTGLPESTLPPFSPNILPRQCDVIQRARMSNYSKLIIVPLIALHRQHSVSKLKFHCKMFNCCAVYVSILLLASLWPALESQRVVEKVDQPRVFLMPSDVIGHFHPHDEAHKVDIDVDCPACLDGRLMAHYVARGCTPVMHGHCQCPSRYKCPVVGNQRAKASTSRPSNSRARTIMSAALVSANQSWSNGDDGACHFGGVTYQLGDLVPSHDPCRICMCDYMDDGTVGIDCEMKIECPLNALRTSRRLAASRKQEAVQLKCYDYFEHDKCCPRQECSPINTRTGRYLRKRKECRYLNKTYQRGQKIDLLGGLDQLMMVSSPSDQNQLKLALNSLTEKLSCTSCICTDSWKDVSARAPLNATSLERVLTTSASCKHINCQLELNQKFRSECIPVFDESKCCPVDYICPRTQPLSMRILGLDFGSKLCRFEGRKYAIGAKLYQQHLRAAPCVECDCLVPPQFTCLVKKNCSDLEY